MKRPTEVAPCRNHPAANDTPMRITHSVTTDAPLPKHTLTTAIDVAETLGWDVTALLAACTVPENSSLAAGGVTPAFVVGADSVATLIRSGDAPLSLTGGDAPAGAGTGGGSEHVTTHTVRNDMSVREVLTHLAETGQLEAFAEQAAPVVPDGIDVHAVVVFAVATYAKGWVAEQAITSHERFSKGSQSNDEAGQDVYDHEREEYRQVKSVTATTDAPDGTLFYQWDCRGGLVVGDDHKEVNKAAGEVSGRVVPYTGEITPTETLRCHSANTDDDGNTYRYLWW